MVSCSPRRVITSEFVSLLENGRPAIEQEDDLHLLAKSMPAHIKLLETLLANDPDNDRLLILLARLYAGYAFAILESELEARRLDMPTVVDTGIPDGQLDGAVARYYHRGAQYALRSLGIRHPQAQARLNQLSSAGDFIRSLDTGDVPALFWYGFNLGGVVRHRLDSVEAMARAHLVEKAMGRVVELNPAYDHGNAYLVLLVYHASRPPMMGGSPEKARKYYLLHQQSKTPTASLDDVFLARYVLVQEQEKDAFTERLTAVATKAETDGPISLMERVAVVRARLYLKASDRFFD